MDDGWSSCRGMATHSTCCLSSQRTPTRPALCHRGSVDRTISKSTACLFVAILAELNDQAYSLTTSVAVWPWPRPIPASRPHFSLLAEPVPKVLASGMKENNGISPLGGLLWTMSFKLKGKFRCDAATADGVERLQEIPASLLVWCDDGKCRDHLIVSFFQKCFF